MTTTPETQLRDSGGRYAKMYTAEERVKLLSPEDSPLAEEWARYDAEVAGEEYVPRRAAEYPPEAADEPADEPDGTDETDPDQGESEPEAPDLDEDIPEPFWLRDDVDDGEPLHARDPREVDEPPASAPPPPVEGEERRSGTRIIDNEGRTVIVEDVDDDDDLDDDRPRGGFGSGRGMRGMGGMLGMGRGMGMGAGGRGGKGQGEPKGVVRGYLSMFTSFLQKLVGGGGRGR